MDRGEPRLFPGCLSFSAQLSSSNVCLLDFEGSVALDPFLVSNGVLLPVLVRLMVVSLQLVSNSITYG